MNPTAIVLRWYRGTAGGAPPQPEQYTTEEVLQLLRPDHHTVETVEANAESPDKQPIGKHTGLAPDTSARCAAVRAVAAQPSAWLGRLSKQHRREIGALADRLPTLVFHHSIGGQPADLLRRFGGWSAWRYERALELAAGCIAGELNHGQLAA